MRLSARISMHDRSKDRLSNAQRCPNPSERNSMSFRPSSVQSLDGNRRKHACTTSHSCASIPREIPCHWHALLFPPSPPLSLSLFLSRYALTAPAPAIALLTSGPIDFWAKLSRSRLIALAAIACITLRNGAPQRE